MSIHPHFDLAYAIDGRIVTMNAQHTVINRGRVFVKDGVIIDISPVTEGYPAQMMKMKKKRKWPDYG